jgi:hypothetical protein
METQMFDEEIGKSLPTPGDLHVSGALTNVAIAWKQESSRFAAGKVFPEVPVDKQSDYYHTWERGDFFRDEAEEIGPQGKTPLMDLRKSSAQYNCKVYGIGGFISEQDMANQDVAVDKEQAMTRASITKLLIKRERIWVTNFFTTGLWKGSTTGTDLVGGVDFTQFSTFATSDPISVLRPQIHQMAMLGIDPMDMVLTMGPAVWQWIVDHPDFLGRYEQVQAAILNEALVAAVLGIREVVVPFGSHTTSKQGVADASTTIDFILGKNMLLSYSPRAPSIEQPSAGYMFTWRNLIGAGEDGIRVRRVPCDDPFGVKVIGNSAFDAKLTSDVCGVFFSNAVA